MGKNNVTFTELQAYLDCLKKRGVDATRIPGLPLTEADFRLWWDRITASDDLQNRWTRRIRLREQFITELAEEIIAMKSLCRVASSRRPPPGIAKLLYGNGLNASFSGFVPSAPNHYLPPEVGKTHPRGKRRDFWHWRATVLKHFHLS